MPEVQEVFRMATQKVQPDPGALERQHRDQRRRVARKKTAVYALVAALVVAGVVIGINALPSDDSQPATGSTPTPVPTPTPIPSLPEGALDAGTYVLSAVDPDFDASHRITISVPGGYEGLFGWMVSGPNTNLNSGVVYNVFTDPCHWSGTLLDPPVGPRVDDLVTAMANQPGHATAPTDVTLDGYAGKQMELTTPADFADCNQGQIRSWTYAPGESDYRSHEPGDRSVLWILDVDGVRLVLEATYAPGASAQDRAEILQMVESVQIDPR